MATATTKPRAVPAVSRRQIQRLADEIARRFHPRKIILFGSYARGDAGVDSDVDLLVITRRKQDSLPILRAISHPFSMDLLVLGEKAFRERLAEGDFFLQDITEQGLVLYEEDH